MNPLLILFAGGTLLLIGGKKKKSSKVSEQNSESVQESEMDEGSGPSPKRSEREVPGYGIVESGIRTDRRGQHPWRVYYDADGYHAQIMLDSSRFSPIQDEVGITASAQAARDLLRTRFNELLIEKYPNEKPKNDPPAARSRR